MENPKGFIILTDPKFDIVSDFEKGYAEVEYTRYLNSEGKLTYREYATKTENKKEYFCADGKTYSKTEFEIENLPSKIIPQKQIDLIAFCENNLWGFKRQNDSIKIKPRFEEVMPFQNGFAKIKLDNGWGLINENGEIVLHDDFIEIGDVYNNIIWYKLNVSKRFLHYTGFDAYYKVENYKLYGYLIYADLQTDLKNLISQYDEINVKLKKNMPGAERDYLDRMVRNIEYKINRIFKIKSEYKQTLFWEGY